MQAHKRPARQGWIWLQAGFALWRSAPLALSAAAMTTVLCLFVAAIVPLGALALPVLLPAFDVGMFLCCNAVANRQPLPPGLLFLRFGERLKQLLGLAAVRFLAVAISMFAGLALSGLSMAQLNPPENATEQAAAAYVAQVLPAMGWILLMRAPAEMATWFAAPLICLRRVPLLKALFFSFVACWRNLGALLVFLLSFVLIAGFLPALLLGAAPALASVLIGALLMMLAPVFCGAFYASARDIFGEWPSP